MDEPVQHSAIKDVSDEQQNMGADSSMIDKNIVQQLEDTVANISMIIHHLAAIMVKTKDHMCDKKQNPPLPPCC